MKKLITHSLFCISVVFFGCTSFQQNVTRAEVLDAEFGPKPSDVEGILKDSNFWERLRSYAGDVRFRDLPGQPNPFKAYNSSSGQFGWGALFRTTRDDVDWTIFVKNGKAVDFDGTLWDTFRRYEKVRSPFDPNLHNGSQLATIPVEWLRPKDAPKLGMGVKYLIRVQRADGSNLKEVGFLRQRELVLNSEWVMNDAVIINQVAKGGPAGNAGISLGDQIVEMAGIAIHSGNAFTSAYSKIILEANPGDEVKVIVRRKGERVVLTLFPVPNN